LPSLPRIIGEKQMTGGLALTPVKKLNGARFKMPFGLNGADHQFANIAVIVILRRDDH